MTRNDERRTRKASCARAQREVERLTATPGQAQGQTSVSRSATGAPRAPSRVEDALIVAIGDLHGHYSALEQLLESLDRSYRIFRQNAPDLLRRNVTLVFTGDYIDRGSSGLQIIDRLQGLEGPNPGQIVALLGNHELMALECYDDAVALLERSGAVGVRGAIREYRTLNDHGWNGGTDFVQEFGTTSLSALEAYVDRMARTGDVGRWMRALQPCHRARVAGHGILFMHADLQATFRNRKRLEQHLEDMRGWQMMGSPAVGGTRAKWARLATFVWDRSYSALSPMTTHAAEAVCRSVGVDFIVTGHTCHPSVDGIKVHGGRIFDIDVGMTPSCGGNMPQALLLLENEIVGFRADGRERVLRRFTGGRAARTGRVEELNGRFGLL